MYLMKRTEDEIDTVLSAAIDNPGRFFGLSYEDGVLAGIKWIVGEEDESPMADE